MIGFISRRSVARVERERERERERARERGERRAREKAGVEKRTRDRK
jgi:hypothetical protein